MRVTSSAKDAVEERIHRLDDSVTIGTFARQQQATANESLDFTIAQFEPIAAKAVAAALPATAKKYTPMIGTSYTEFAIRACISEAALSAP